MGEVLKCDIISGKEKEGLLRGSTETRFAKLIFNLFS